jgi:hypothetical protein
MTDEPRLPGTLENPSPYDALPRLRPLEPYFILLGRSAQSVQRVLDWADAHRKLWRDCEDEAERTFELKKANEAEEIAWAMQSYRSGQPDKVEDKKLSYAGDDITKEAWQVQLAKGVQHLREASHQIASAIEIFGELELLGPLTETRLRECIRLADDEAAKREPKHASWSKRPTLMEIDGAG